MQDQFVKALIGHFYTRIIKFRQKEMCYRIPVRDTLVKIYLFHLFLQSKAWGQNKNITY